MTVWVYQLYTAGKKNQKENKMKHIEEEYNKCPLTKGSVAGGEPETLLGQISQDKKATTGYSNNMNTLVF